MRPRCNICNSPMFFAGGLMDGSVKYYKCGSCGNEIHDINHEVLQNDSEITNLAPMKLVQVNHTKDGQSPARG